MNIQYILLYTALWVISEILVKTSETDGAPGLPGHHCCPLCHQAWGVRPGSRVITLLPASQPSHPQFPDLQPGIRELKLNHHALVLSDNTGSLQSVFLSLGGISERSKYRKSMRSFLILPGNLYLFIPLMGAFSHVFLVIFYYTGQSLPSKYFILLICLVIKKKLQLFS